jgi:hypothetical protein
MESLNITMKRLLFILSILLLYSMCPAQTPTFSEWFRQKKTQKKYHAQQINALQVYLEFVKKGYGVAGRPKSMRFSLTGNTWWCA